MPFLTYLDPASVDPGDLVDRDGIVRWLRQSLDSFLCAPDKSRGRASAILGERGIGKSIVMRKVIDDLRELHTATTLFLVVDCRNVGDQRRVIHELARQIVDALGVRNNLKPELLDTARLLETVARFDDVERRVLAEHATSHKAALRLNNKQHLLAMLRIGYDINVERSSSSRESLEGAIRFDATRLRDALLALLADLRDHGLDTIVVLDNLDELRHEALVDDDLRTWLYGEIDGLLALARAPIGLLVTARTYFAGSLNRQIDATKVVHRLGEADHVEIIQRRLAHESPEVRAAFTESACAGCIERLAALAHTPLALLSWFRYLAENELHAAGDVREALGGLLDDRFANFRRPILDEVVAAFAGKPYEPQPSERLLDACKGNQASFKQLLRSQVVLPVDFWDPHEFTLAPELHFLGTEGS
jgi:hypothetical protein